ncbi:MAG: S9 family peptidase [candidate division Zixibacteria bacterium]|nr:S9 family peptidase [candidate division Zixibacteria bacterium]
MTGCNSRQSAIPPTAKIETKADTLFDDIRVDNYFWLRGKENPEVIAYLEAENEYTQAMMKHTEDFQEKLYQEMVGRIQETDMDVPDKINDYLYYERTEEGKQYEIYCRKKGSLEAEEEILIDANELAGDYEFFEIGSYEVSDDHNTLAYTVDTSGAEQYTIFFKDLKTGKYLDDQIHNADYEIAWPNDNKTIFYATLDDIKRPDKLWRHKIGDKQENDVMVYHESDESFYLSISKTKSKEYLIIKLSANITSEARYLKADNPTGKFRLIHPREHGVEYYVGEHDGKFIIRTNDKAKNFKIVTVSTKNPAKHNWRDLIGHRDSVRIGDFEEFSGHLVVFEREKGLPNIRVIAFDGANDFYIDFPEPVYHIWGTGNYEYETTKLRFGYTSLVTSKSIFDYDMISKERDLKKQYAVLGGYQPENYQMERIFAEASDGAMVPISLVYKKGLKKDGSNPTVLYVYGAYGVNENPWFSSNRYSLIDRGFIWAIAHVRGGGEMGELWYEDGKLLKKKNTFSDLNACAEHLIAQKFTSGDKIVCWGGSAGGLTVGAASDLRPDLYHAVIADVPFVDIINTMLDESIPLTVTEYDEWGNPNNEEFYFYMKSYSPYDNVTARDYPHMLILAGLNDPRVMYWEPAKWTAKLRAHKTDYNILLLKTNMGSGHMGASGRYDYIKEVAFQYAFVLDLFGLGE